ncbi:putative adenylate-forming enzyme [Psychromicrobium silvestre]|uniref:Putative adenylate-forming enzyme n=1 Tax=Psychromicrobium silvestre TaxID=1645614 RepID=A0A7Y9LS09_9MICC|nr:F390 synthetase-related protein [Psychromicrobium silvestre]NYE94528.1 putative adenylate-forming enzyme [Psychromicrobium silvestre]
MTRTDSRGTSGARAAVVPVSDLLAAGFLFCRTRWGYRFRNRAALLRWQQRRLDKMLQGRGLHWRELPVIDKSIVLADFERYNSQGVSLAEALELAKASERSRDFRAELDGLTVGLSSGTSGRHGVFLLSSTERLLWAGTILARVLDSAALRQILSPWKPALRIAFLLRADSNLYNTVRSSRVAFDFYDLLEPLESHFEKLNSRQAELLIGPASVLRALAEAQLSGRLSLRPRKILSVAEELDESDAEFLERSFGVRPGQVYQATEGLLGFSCRLGTLHLNEQHVHFEQEWLDAERSRFVPIITDFTRSTQLMLRYRLDDVLRVAEHPCRCGNPALALAGVDGRADAVLVFDGVNIFPDVLRRAMALASTEFQDWSVAQSGKRLLIGLRAPSQEAEERVRDELTALFARYRLSVPKLEFGSWQAPAPGAKLRRIQLLAADARREGSTA